MLYAFFDGDNIGPTIEILLTENRIDEAVNLSKSINTVISEIEGILKSKDGIEIIILGGDDILIRYDTLKHGNELLEEIRNTFKARTGNSMSCGVGKDIPESIWNLHLAKLHGKNMIKGTD
jgi:hypothetical protein